MPRTIVQRVQEENGKVFDVTFQETSKVEVTRESEAVTLVRSILDTRGISESTAIATEIVSALKTKGASI